MKTLYTAQVHVSGGRGHGKARSSDGNLEIILSTPGSGGKGTNPEQLLAAGWSACFEDAIGIAAYMKSITLPFNRSIDAEIDLVSDKGEFSLQARMKISIPGLQKEVAEQLIEYARHICPYTTSLEGKVPIEFTLV